MKYVVWVVIAVLAVLGLSSGAAKMMQMPAEVEFFALGGLSPNVLIVFGAIQVIGGVLTVFAPYRVLGLLLLIVTFAFSSYLLFLHGGMSFAIFSCVPVVLAIAMIVVTRRRRRR